MGKYQGNNTFASQEDRIAHFISSVRQLGSKTQKPFKLQLLTGARPCIRSQRNCEAHQWDSKGDSFVSARELRQALRVKRSAHQNCASSWTTVQHNPHVHPLRRCGHQSAFACSDCQMQWKPSTKGAHFSAVVANSASTSRPEAEKGLIGGVSQARAAKSSCV